MASSVKLGAREVQPGDLVGFGPAKDGTKHIGIVVAIKQDYNGKLHYMVRHNSTSRGVVTEDLENMWSFKNGQFMNGGGFFRPKAVI
ncbi:hypothetical protein ABTH28_18155, partial [Acinetobacter baumannii]